METEKRFIVKAVVVIVGCLCVTGLEVYALHKGIDGLALTGSMTAIGVVIGLFFPKKGAKKNE